MPRILHILGDSEFGGGSYLVIRYAEAARERGWHVDVLTTNARFQKHLDEHGIGVVDLDVIWRPIRPWKDYWGGRRLARFLAASEYDVVHTHTSKAGIVGRWAAHKAGIQGIMHTVHGFAFHEASPRMTIQAFAFLERLAAGWCHRIVTVADFHRDWALQLGIGDPNKVVAIPNGIPAPAPEPPATTAQLASELRQDENELLMLSAGRLAEQKGLEYLIAGMAEIQRRVDQPIRLILAGDGPFRETLQELVQDANVADAVTFLGYRKDVPSLLRAADMVVMPSEREGLSISLLEAMACKRPVVSTTIGSTREATGDGVGAILVAPRDTRALVDAVCELAASEERRRQLAEAGHRLYLERYTEQRMLNAYLNLYAELSEDRENCDDD